MKNIGYLILQKPELIIKSYEERIASGNFGDKYKRFRNALSDFNPTNYLGISRLPLFGVPKELQSTYEEIFEPEAQDYIAILEEQNLSDSDLIFEHDEAIKIFTKIIHKQCYDIVCVRNDFFKNNTNVLGFDIGYWDGDHFSLIADTIVIPTWHGPPEKDYDELANKLKSLNENLLFNTFKEADDFKKYYKTKSWAEIEDFEGEFCIIKVQKVFYLI